MARRAERRFPRGAIQVAKEFVTAGQPARNFLVESIPLYLVAEWFINPSASADGPTVSRARVEHPQNRDEEQGGAVEPCRGQSGPERMVRRASPPGGQSAARRSSQLWPSLKPPRPTLRKPPDAAWWSTISLTSPATPIQKPFGARTRISSPDQSMLTTLTSSAESAGPFSNIPITRQLCWRLKNPSRSLMMVLQASGVHGGR